MLTAVLLHHGSKRGRGKCVVSCRKRLLDMSEFLNRELAGSSFWPPEQIPALQEALFLSGIHDESDFRRENALQLAMDKVCSFSLRQIAEQQQQQQQQQQHVRIPILSR